MRFIIVKAEENESRLFADIIEAAWNSLEKKEWFSADNAEYIDRMMKEGRGMGYKAVETESGATAGVFHVTFPGLSEENLGRDIGLEEEKLDLVAHMDSVAVLPEYRGHGLQMKLMQTAERELEGMGIRYLMCTVHPDNGYSRRNMVRQGYRAVKKVFKYGGYEREIFLKMIPASEENPMPAFEEKTGQRLSKN